MAYPVFLLVLTVPALEWLFAPHSPKRSGEERSRETIDGEQFQAGIRGISRPARLCILFLLLSTTVLQGARFQVAFRRDGPKRQYEFDVPYKDVDDAAIAQPIRPIYLQDGKWGPAYMHAMWYSTIEGRPRSEFVHLPDRGKGPRGSVVISWAENCQNCECIKAKLRLFCLPGEIEPLTSKLNCFQKIGQHNMNARAGRRCEPRGQLHSGPRESTFAFRPGVKMLSETICSRQRTRQTPWTCDVDSVPR